MPYELQVNVPKHGWHTVEWHTDQMEAIRSMDDLHGKFRNAELRVVNVVHAITKEEETT